MIEILELICLIFGTLILGGAILFLSCVGFGTLLALGFVWTTAVFRIVRNWLLNVK